MKSNISDTLDDETIFLKDDLKSDVYRFGFLCFLTLR